MAKYLYINIYMYTWCQGIKNYQRIDSNTQTRNECRVFANYEKHVRILNALLFLFCSPGTQTHLSFVLERECIHVHTKPDTKRIQQSRNFATHLHCPSRH